MGLRQELVKEFVSLFGKKNFRYGAYKSKPTTPYALYMRSGSYNMAADDRVYAKFNEYELRVVTDEKDFTLEKKIEDIFDEHEIVYEVFNEEDFEEEKVHVTEWSFYLHED